jgi:carbamoyl-phosphate synthase small subunit
LSNVEATESGARRIVLDDGYSAEGASFGADCDVEGEVVFTTAHSGYVEALTDPSYRGQILVMTNPLQGNYGVSAGPHESTKIQVQGLVVSRHARSPSHHRAVSSLGEWLRAAGVPAIEAVDTRTLTRHLRERGTMVGRLVTASAMHDRAATRATAVDMENVAALVAPREITRVPGGSPHILLIDTGAKEGIVRALSRRGATVTRAPFMCAWEPLLDEVDGVVLGNGPGDPASLQPLIARLREVLARGLPTFGICLGHQLLALAAGATTYKLPYGHRSHNQPVTNLSTHRAYLTSQNHGYAVRADSLPRDWESWFTNLNDGTNEGIRHSFRPFRSVQFHPEATAGPRDTSFLFDDFLHMVVTMRKAHGA